MTPEGNREIREIREGFTGRSKDPDKNISDLLIF